MILAERKTQKNIFNLLRTKWEPFQRMKKKKKSYTAHHSSVLAPFIGIPPQQVIPSPFSIPSPSPFLLEVLDISIGILPIAFRDINAGKRRLVLNLPPLKVNFIILLRFGSRK